MSAVTRPRGPLPPRVYWTRRALVVVLGLALAVVAGRLLTSSGAVPDGAAARAVSGTPTSTPTGIPTSTPTVTPVATRDPTRTTTPPATSTEQKVAGLPPPEGVCEDSDIVVTPRVDDAHVGDPITVALDVTTQEARACAWKVSPESVFVNITDDGKTLWTSQFCSRAIPTEVVVPRRKTPATVELTWNGKESDAECSVDTDFVFPGVYGIDAVARGALTPVQTAFVLGAGTRETVTVTASPTPTPSADLDPDE